MRGELSKVIPKMVFAYGTYWNTYSYRTGECFVVPLLAVTALGRCRVLNRIHRNAILSRQLTTPAPDPLAVIARIPKGDAAISSSGQFGSLGWTAGESLSPIRRGFLTRINYLCTHAKSVAAKHFLDSLVMNKFPRISRHRFWCIIRDRYLAAGKWTR